MRRAKLILRFQKMQGVSDTIINRVSEELSENEDINLDFTDILFNTLLLMSPETPFDMHDEILEAIIQRIVSNG